MSRRSRYGQAKRFVLTGQSNGIKISPCGFKVPSDPGHIRALCSAVLIRYPSMNRRCVGVSGLISRCTLEGVRTVWIKVSLVSLARAF